MAVAPILQLTHSRFFTRRCSSHDLLAWLKLSEYEYVFLIKNCAIMENLARPHCGAFYLPYTLTFTICKGFLNA
jgi:hypothetical protein